MRCCLSDGRCLEETATTPKAEEEAEQFEDM